VCILNDVKDDKRSGSPGGNRFTRGESAAEDRRNVTDARDSRQGTRSSELTPMQHCVYDMYPCTRQGTLCVDTC
jgi:hypothetical protein